MENYFDNEEEEYLSLSKAADLLGVSKKTLRNWDEQGKLRTARTPGNHRRIPVTEITRLLQEEQNGEDDLSWKVLGVDMNSGEKSTSATITPSEYRAHLKRFGLEDVEDLDIGRLDSALTPELNLEGEFNRDEVTQFVRALAHKIEDILDSRLTDREFQNINNIVTQVHERTIKSKPKIIRPVIRPGYIGRGANGDLGYLQIGGDGC